jgi:hypothetical protein
MTSRGVKRFEYFLDFCLHQKLHIECDLAAASGDKPKETSDLRDTVAHCVPGNFGLGELEVLHQLVLHFQPILAQRGQRSGGAAELADQHARLHLVQSLLMPLECGQHRCHLVAKRDRHGLLQVASPGHRRVTVLFRKRGEAIANSVDILLDDCERLANLHDCCGISDVLGGGAPMRPFTEAVLAKLHQLLDDRQDRIADLFGRFL